MVHSTIMPSMIHSWVIDVMNKAVIKLAAMPKLKPIVYRANPDTVFSSNETLTMPINKTLKFNNHCAIPGNEALSIPSL